MEEKDEQGRENEAPQEKELLSEEERSGNRNNTWRKRNKSRSKI